MRRLLRSALLSTAALTTSNAYTATVTMSATGDVAPPTPKHTLYDMPVSNNGARCRLILYKKNIPSSEVSIVPPSALGGLKSPEYLALNPQGKMPLLAVSETSGSGGGGIAALPESDTICRYLTSKYRDVGPSFLPDDPRSNLIARLHDVYVAPVQGCLYKPAGYPFGIHRMRKDAVAELRKQLGIIDGAIEEGGETDGLYLCGREVSLADATLFPTMVFVKYMLPKFDVPENEALPPKIGAWFDAVKEGDPDFARVYDEVHGALEQWDANGRWDTIWMAGVRDAAPETIFDKIVAGDIPASIVRDEKDLLAFEDINPASPAHVLVIPKDRAGLSSLRESNPEHIEILGKLLVAAGEIARDESLGFGDGARIVINDGKDGGQEVPHLHVHVLGGRELTWPPG